MSTFARREDGQQIVLVALMLPVLLAFVGLVLDVGNVYFHRRMAQNAADAAAMAGSVQLAISRPQAQQTALAYAADNGYNNDGQSNTVTITFPSGCIAAQVDENVRPLLVSLVWDGSFNVGARAVACRRAVPVPASVIVLDQGRRDGALRISGNSSLVVERGNVHVNSSSPQAVTMGGSKSQVNTQTPATIVGGTSALDAFRPPPLTGAGVLADPLAHLPEPRKPAKCSSRQVNDNSDLVSGVFCYTGGISLNSSDSLRLPPGEYWIEGGISVNGTKAKIVADNVMFYIASGDVSIKKCSDCRFTPRTTGDYKGLTLYGARGNPPTFDFTAGADLYLAGIVYNKNGALELSGGADIVANFAVGTVNMTGNTDLVVEGFTSPNWETIEYRMTE